MKKIIKNKTFLFSLLLFIVAYKGYSAQLVKETDRKGPQKGYRFVPYYKRNFISNGYCRAYEVPADICFLIRCLVYDNPLKYKNKQLPTDLSKRDLRGFDFTGCQFTNTNLSESKLNHVILTNTTCDYQQLFQNKVQEHKVGKSWYREKVPQDLRSITLVYPQLPNSQDKAQLLWIASGLSLLPLSWEGELYIKFGYWSCFLLRLKRRLPQSYGNQLVCSLEEELDWDAEYYCWKTEYPQNKIDIAGHPPHADFDQYIQEFTAGLKKYQCSSKKSLGFNYYESHIKLSIQGLKRVFRKVKSNYLRHEMCRIAYGLSKAYQMQHMNLLYSYLFYQNRLIRLAKLLPVPTNYDIHYHDFLTRRFP